MVWDHFALELSFYHCELPPYVSGTRFNTICNDQKGWRKSKSNSSPGERQFKEESDSVDRETM